MYAIRLQIFYDVVNTGNLTITPFINRMFYDLLLYSVIFSLSSSVFLLYPFYDYTVMWTIYFIKCTYYVFFDFPPHLQCLPVVHSARSISLSSSKGDNMIFSNIYIYTQWMNYRVNTSFAILTNNCNFKVINLLISKKKDSNAAHTKNVYWRSTIVH